MGVFQKIGGLKPGRSRFRLNHTVKTTFDMGQLIPIFCEEVNPGERFKIMTELVLRFQALAAPIMHEVKAYIDFWFTPYRLLYDKWEDFYTRGRLGDKVEVPLPLGVISSVTSTDYADYCKVGSLWDYFGLPVKVNGNALVNNGRDTAWFTSTSLMQNAVNANIMPLDWWRRSYVFIYNENYRDQNLEKPYAFKESHVRILNPTWADNPFLNDVGNMTAVDDYQIAGRRIFRPFYCAWRKDYFTSALPFVQRGQAPALPYASVAVPTFPPISIGEIPDPGMSGPFDQRAGVFFDNTGYPLSGYSALPVFSNGLGNSATQQDRYNAAQSMANRIQDYLSQGSVTLSGLFNINDMRQAWQIQLWLERNARAGVRYIEFLRAHFGVSPRDDRLDRPEYLGGSRSDVIVSEVLQTSQTTETSPQAQMAGHGLIADRTYCVNYKVQEPGVIIGLIRVLPRPSYMQGMRRMWLRRTTYDYYFREFANLGEQEIYNAELYYDPTSLDMRTPFGFTGRYNEFRYIPSYCTGLMRFAGDRGGFDYWHLSRKFTGLPFLNEDFIKMHGDNPTYKRVFAVENQPGLIATIGFYVDAVRLMPYTANPGLVDHF